MNSESPVFCKRSILESFLVCMTDTLLVLTWKQLGGEQSVDWCASSQSWMDS